MTLSRTECAWASPNRSLTSVLPKFPRPSASGLLSHQPAVPAHRRRGNSCAPRRWLFSRAKAEGREVPDSGPPAGVAPWWVSLGTSVPFPWNQRGFTLIASSSGGGLPGRPATRKSRDARLIFGRVWLGSRGGRTEEPAFVPAGEMSIAYIGLPTLPCPGCDSASPARLPTCSLLALASACCPGRTV
jgi:hypothetical protein